MGQTIWIFAALAAVSIMVGLAAFEGKPTLESDAHPSDATMYLSARTAPETTELGSSGRAISTAAFGLSALQPATYNGEVVLEIIDASHLDETAKRDLVQDLAAAESGHADLHEVLADVRVALAVE